MHAIFYKVTSFFLYSMLKALFVFFEQSSISLLGIDVDELNNSQLDKVEKIRQIIVLEKYNI